MLLPRVLGAISTADATATWWTTIEMQILDKILAVALDRSHPQPETSHANLAGQTASSCMTDHRRTLESSNPFPDKGSSSVPRRTNAWPNWPGSS